jgi:hypothetical protein
VDSNCHCCPSIVDWTEHMASCSPCCWVCEYKNLFVFCPATYTSSVALSRSMCCIDESVSFQNQRHTLCVSPVKFPTFGVPPLLRHISFIALCHNSMSEAVGCSLGHLIVDQALPLGRHDKISMHTFPPDAVNTSDKKSTWSDMQTRFSHRSVSPVYPARISICIKN